MAEGSQSDFTFIDQQPSSAIRIRADVSWVADEPRETESVYQGCESDIPETMCTDIQTPHTEDFEVRIPTARHRICGNWAWGTIPMYEIAFKHLGIRLPFTDLEVSIFRHLHLAPSQLHPNSLAFIKAFEKTAEYLGLGPTLPLFFYHFGLQRSCPRGEQAKGKLAKGAPVPSTKHGWVSLRQRKRLFDMFDESVRGFKSVFYGVRPITTKGWNNFVRRGHRIDELGQEVLDEQGLPIEEDFARFPFYWRRDHYSMSTKEFVFTLGALSAEERADYKKLLEFVEGLPPFLLSDSNGEPLLGEDGRRLTCPKVIATKELLACDTSEKLTVFWSMLIAFFIYFILTVIAFSICSPSVLLTDAPICVGTMTSGSAALRKARAAKNKREASSAATTSSAPQSPTASNVDRSKRTRLEEETSSRQDHVVVDLSGQDDPPLPGPHKLTAGLPADDFVLPPLYAHGELLTGATKVKINPADEAILSDMGPEVLRAEIAAQSMALLKLVEMATFLNGRECKYLEERDEARKELPSLQRRLAESEASCEVFREERKTLSANLKEAEDRLKTVSEERDSAVQKVDEQKGLISELEGKLERLQVTGVVEDREKELDPQGEYASSSRADMLAKIQELESSMVAAAAFSFNNAVAQLRILNPGLNEEGLDEEKEVRDGAIVTPPDDDEV
ncbi:unnamed protein product [Trifolium pratense]|uniref:Uncharacterized protein n=1 Tax=Trifolium pratense TaxID=57577 RepID=A0ACB0M5G1_TRIPR|nr:unnamed protein product [Trifolium pratense]